MPEVDIEDNFVRLSVKQQHRHRSPLLYTHPRTAHAETRNELASLLPDDINDRLHVDVSPGKR